MESSQQYVNDRVATYLPFKLDVPVGATSPTTVNVCPLTSVSTDRCSPFALVATWPDDRVVGFPSTIATTGPEGTSAALTAAVGVNVEV